MKIWHEVKNVPDSFARFFRSDNIRIFAISIIGEKTEARLPLHCGRSERSTQAHGKKDSNYNALTDEQKNFVEENFRELREAEMFEKISEM